MRIGIPDSFPISTNSKLTNFDRENMPPITNAGIVQKHSFKSTRESTNGPVPVGKQANVQDIPQPPNHMRISLMSGEFIAFASYKLLVPKNCKRRQTCQELLDSNPDKRETFEEYANLVCPAGTEDWYPVFVFRVHSLLNMCALPTAITFIALMFLARLRKFCSDYDTDEPDQEFKLFLAALILAQKQNSDPRYANKAWAKMSCLSVGEVNRIERELAFKIGYKLHVTDNQYRQWVSTIEALGKEHTLVLRAVKMAEQELQALTAQLKSRNDLVQEIELIRNSRAVRSHATAWV
jgi:hypothetical protein